ncbi:MAG: TRCF domain-containing protein, partial [candidate division WOR-3 bacterium]
KQHGFIKGLGYNLFFKILDEEIKRVKGERIEEKKGKIQVESDIYIPRDYIEDEEVIISIYKRLSEAKNISEIKEIYEEIKDRFGKMPENLKKIFLFFYLKNLKEFEKMIILEKGILLDKKFYKAKDFSL